MAILIFFIPVAAAPIWLCLKVAEKSVVTKRLLVFLSFPQMTEGRRCQVHLLDDRKLELLVQVSLPPCPSPLSLVIPPRCFAVPSVQPLRSSERAGRDIRRAEGLGKAERGKFGQR